MKRITPKKKWRLKRGKEGVSEVVGNLLILAITVTLFSSVLWYVGAMPTPNEGVYADFSSNVVFDDQVAKISVTHMGGQTLNDFRTKIYLFVDGEPTTLSLSNGSIDSKWETGKTWTYTYDRTVVNSSTKISMMIVDIEANTIVWDSILNGEQGNSPPIIKARGLKLTGKSVNVPYYSGNKVQFFAEVVDLDGDLDYVYVDASNIGQDSNIPLIFDASHNLFVSRNFTAQASWHNEAVIFYAQDKAGHLGWARQVLSVTSLPTSGGSGGNPPPNINYSGLQGFSFFEEQDWLANRFGASPTNSFEFGETVVVVVSSTYLVNTENENLLLVMDPNTKAILHQAIFESDEYYSGYYVYTANFDTQNDLGQDNKKYLVQIQLRDNWIPNNIFFASDQITVGDASLPSFKTFSDSSYQMESREFTTNDKIYVQVKNINGGIWDYWGGDVSIRDFFGREQLKRIPSDEPFNPVSNVTRVGMNEYRFVIDLALAQQEPWIPGTNHYILTYDMFRTNFPDGSHESHQLTKVIQITAPKMKLDIVAAVEPPQAGGTFVERNTMYYYENDNQWNPPAIIQGYGDYNKDAAGVLVGTGDMTGDGKNDMVAVVKDARSAYELNLYLNDGSWTRRNIASTETGTLPGRPTALELGNIDYDSDLDIILGFSNGMVGFYRNDGLWTWTQIPTTSNQAITHIEVGDLDSDRPGNDPARSLDVVAGRAGGGVTVHKNLDGIGTSWLERVFSGGSTEQFVRNAESDIPIFGTVEGTYFDTTVSSGYQKITEVSTSLTTNYVPTSFGAEDSTQSSIGWLEEDDGSLVAVSSNSVLHIDGWGTPSGTPSGDIVNIEFEMKYNTGSWYDGSDVVKWGLSSENPEDLDEVLKSDGTPMTVTMNTEFQIVRSGPLALEGISSISDLSGLQFWFQNTQLSWGNKNVSVGFDYWRLLVRTDGGPLGIEHIWTFSLNPEDGSASRSLYMKTNSSSVENFTVSYSIDNITYHEIMTLDSTGLEENTGSMSNIPSTYQGILYVKVVDANRTSSDITPTSLYVHRMWITETLTTDNPIDRVNGIGIGNVLSGGPNEIAVIDSTGKFWLLSYHYATETILASLVDCTAPSNILDLSIGQFLAGNHLDILVATFFGIYVMNQATAGTFELKQLSITPPATITCMGAGDVDGNGWTDVVIGTYSGDIMLYRNLDGLQTEGWQTILIDRPATSHGSYHIVDIGIGKLENA